MATQLLKTVRFSLNFNIARPNVLKSNQPINPIRNTKFFQTVVKHRRARNKILQVKDEDGRLTDKPEEIENILGNHFKSSYELQHHTSVDSIIQELQNLPVPKLSRALALKNANAISKAFLAFHNSKTFASKNGIPYYCKIFCNSATVQF